MPGLKRKRKANARPPQAISKRRKPTPSVSVLTNPRSGGFIGLESKFLDCTKNSTNVTAAWTTFSPTAGCTNSISVPARGTGESEREGRAYKITSVHIKGEITLASAESQAAPRDPQPTRLVCYIDHQTNIAVAGPTTLYTPVNEYLGFRNLENSKRFTILWDKVIWTKVSNMNEGAANLFAWETGRTAFKFNKQFKVPLRVETNSGATADVANVIDNNINIIAICPGGNTFCEYQTRVRFTA